MWRCENCKEIIKNGAYCEACGRPIDEALSAISRKARSVRFRHGVANRWAWRGAKTGFAVGVILSLIFAALLTVRHVVHLPQQETMRDVLLLVLVVFLTQAVILLPMLFAFLFLLFGAVIKPICIALFCSVERFEQEYGPTET